jgi:hypothetical protein
MAVVLSFFKSKMVIGNTEFHVVFEIQMFILPK